MRRTATLRATAVALAVALAGLPVSAADSGLVTKPSRYSVQQTIDRFENAVIAKGWKVFNEIDHGAAAQEYGLELKPRIVVVYGNPKLFTPTLAISPTLGIDVPFRALVWQNDQGQVYLTYNSADYVANAIYPRHGLTIAGQSPKNLEQFLDEISDRATK